MKNSIKLCILIVMMITISGCYNSNGDTSTPNEENEEQIVNDLQTKETIMKEKVQNFIIENNTFTDYVDGTYNSIVSIYGEMNVSSASIDIKVNDGNIIIESSSSFGSKNDTVKLLEIYKDGDDIKYFTEHIIYEAFCYEKPNEKYNPDHYAAYLKYYGNSNDEETLKLTCYEQFKFDIAYDEDNDIFVDAEVGSSTIGNEMIFKKDLDKQVRIAYNKFVEREEIFNKKLNELIEYIENEVFIEREAV